MVMVDGVPRYEVRLARAGEEDAICDVCREGFTVSSNGLLPTAAVERRAQQYYNPTRVRHEIATAGADLGWQGYVVAVSEAGGVLGAAGGGITDHTVGNVYVLYLNVALRGRGIGTALLDFVTQQQRSEGATEQWVSVTEGNDLGIPFYLARGFVVRDRVPFDVADDGTVGAHSLRMSRPI
ncbi:GNAT superfamily N-acetyltransferase [Nocardioides panaciterrulae]|uniref:GNAT superfamily N-acetyltransferase n=2 Tax=Nocardioides panaciterrulae TaxID=661492 RepID=A0A7Y9E638_9ACTN|nr:GNAT superfamily N-acetyltransferase [Nocardioides panaciterrulae]